MLGLSSTPISGAAVAPASWIVPHLSIVIPVYRSAATLAELMQRLDQVLSSMGGDHEVICVEDRSPDDTWSVLEGLTGQYEWLRAVRLRRNSGQHNALLCGFAHAHGDIVVTMDDDLQNPPEEIPTLVDGLGEGFDVAIGAYEAKQHSAARNAGGGVIDRVQRMLFNLPGDFQLTSFRAIRGDVVKAVAAHPSAFPYITSQILSQSGSCVNVPVRHDPRKEGRSNYALPSSVRLAANLLMAYSTWPLVIAACLCGLVLALSGGISIWVLVQAMVSGDSTPGWASGMLTTTVLTSINIGVLMIVLMYVSRIYRQVSRTSMPFSVEKIVG